MNRKRIIFITVIVLLVILAGLVLYNLLLSKGTVPAITESPFGSPEQFLAEQESVSPNPESALVLLTQQAIVGFRTTDAGIVTFDANGLIQEIDESGSAQDKIADLSLDNVIKAVISPLAEEIAFLFINNDGTAQWAVFNRQESKVRTLGTEVRDVSFSPQGDLLFVSEVDGDTTFTLREGEVEKTIFTSSIPDLVANWVGQDTLALTTKPSGFAPGILYLLDVGTGKVGRVLGGKYGLTGIVSLQKEWVLFSQTANGGGSFSTRMLNLVTQEESVLPFLTLPEKCVFPQDKRFIFCSAFSENPSSNVMPDDYYKDAFSNETSVVFRVNLEEKTVQSLTQTLLIDPVSLELSLDEDWLFFINKKDGNLYRLRLEG